MGAFARAVALVSLLALLVAPLPAAAQEEGFLVEFNFDTLWFRFYPTGLGSSTATGSGIQAFAENVAVEGVNAVDLRHCIDGWDYPECTHGHALSQFSIGNRDGVVTPDEVARFESVAILGVGQIEKVQNLSRMLEQNVRVDGVLGDRARPRALSVDGAEGNINDPSTVHIDVTVEISFANDAKAKRHEILLQDLHLLSEGFEYGQARWTTVSSDPWVFKPDETQPASVQGNVAKDGWTSSQADFEDATEEGLLLVVAQESNKRSPALGVLAVAVVALLAAATVRRRR